MSVGCSVSPVRADEDAPVSFATWEGLNEFEKLAAKTFEEGVEQCLTVFPPSLHVDVSEDEKDVTLTFYLRGLGDGDNGPAWTFSMMDAFSDTKEDCYLDDVRMMARALRAIADFLESMDIEANRS